MFGADATGREISAAPQGRVLPVGQRARGAELALVGDFAGGNGGGMGAGALDGVFGFGANEELSFQRAQAAMGSDDGRVKVLGLIKSADTHATAGRLPEAAKDVESAQNIIQELRFDDGRALAMTMVARIYAKQGSLSTEDQLDEAQDLASEAQEKFQKAGSKKCEAAALLALAAAKYAVKKFDEGMLAAKEAQHLLQEMGDKSAEAMVYYTVCDGFVLKGELKKAVKFMNKGRAIYQELSDKQGQATCYRKIAEVEIQANDRFKAEAALGTARDLFRDLGSLAREVQVLGTLRDFHLKAGRVAEAVDVAKGIVTAYHNVQDAKGEGGSLLSLGNMLLEKEQLELSGQVLTAAHKVFSSVRDQAGLAGCADLNNKLKNEMLKAEIKKSIDDNRHVANYPDEPLIELGLSQVAVNAYNDVAKKGL